MIHVLVVAATPALRAGLRAMLSAPEFEVLAEAPTVAALAISVSDAARADVALLADEAELGSYTATLADVVVVLTDVADAAQRLRDLNLRGWGVVRPDATPAELRGAVAAAAQGFAVLPAQDAEGLLPQRLPISPSEEKIELTPREQEVLELLSRGLPNKSIGAALGISEATVKFHVSAIFAKLGAASRAEAVSRAARAGLITL